MTDKEIYDILGLPSDPYFFSFRDRTPNGSSIQSPEVEELIESLLPESDENYGEEETLVRKKFRQESGCFGEDGFLLVTDSGGDTTHSLGRFEHFVERKVEELHKKITKNEN